MTPTNVQLRVITFDYFLQTTIELFKKKLFWCQNFQTLFNIFHWLKNETV